MSRITHRQIGLEAVLAALSSRFDTDARGRLKAVQGEGVLPRFVLGRSKEGCVWRFRADVPSAVVRRVARLAAREPGMEVGSDADTPPERWAMIERLFEPGEAATRSGDRLGRSASRASSSRRVEVLTRDGVLAGDLWLIE